MPASLSLASAAALFSAMAILAAMPSVSVLAVSARSASSGFMHGALTALGVVVGDIVLILLAIFGLALLVEAMGSLFFVVQYLGGVYLIWLGWRIWMSRHAGTAHPQAEAPSSLSSFMTGLLITLGDQKAILFYLGFLPAFLDLALLSYADIGAVVAITFVAVGGVKLAYAYAAGRTGHVFGGVAGKAMNAIAAGIMGVAGMLVILRAW